MSYVTKALLRVTLNSAKGRKRLAELPRKLITGEFSSQCGRSSTGMKPWPTFRMSFRGFQKAYPEGEVFLNKPSSNLFLRLLDTVTDPVFSIGISQQHREERPVMDNMSHTDDRLPNKTYVWGINLGDDAVCYTQDFVVENGNLVNAMISGHAG